MAPPLTTVRCAACGAPVSVFLAPAPATQWFPCPQCRTPVPVLVPRDPPALYSWEVLPGLYPPLRSPRVPRWRAYRAAGGALLNVAVFAALLTGILGYYAVTADAPGSFSVAGSVVLEDSKGRTIPAAGASIVATDEAGQQFNTTTAGDGQFGLSGLPTGGVALNVSYPRFAPVRVDVFLSTVYSGGATSIVVTLLAGNYSNRSTVSLTPFLDVETFVAAIGGAVVLLGLVTVIAAVSAVVTLRSDRPAVGVVGGGAGVFAPAALALLSLGTAFPVLLAASGILAAIGGFALAIRAVEMGQVGSAPD
jgi:Carboxypeptidase regulatory-like domain